MKTSPLSSLFPAGVRFRVVAALTVTLLCACCQEFPEDTPPELDDTALAAGSTVDVSERRRSTHHRVLPQGVFTNSPDSPVELIAVPDADPALASLAAPVAARLAISNRPSLLIVFPVDDSRDRASAQAIKAGNARRVLVLQSEQYPVIPRSIEGVGTLVHSLPADLAAMSLEFASRYWATSDSVVMTDVSEPENIVRGAALAACKGIPLLLRDGSNYRRIVALLEQKNVQHVLELPPAGSSRMFRYDRRPSNVSIVSLSREAADRMLIEAIGPSRVRNVILTRLTPREAGVMLNTTPWLAPYLSLVRRSPIVFARSPDPRLAEAAVERFLEQHSLSPRSVTIFADDALIEARTLLLGNEMQVTVEPFSMPGGSKALSLAVGRIPFLDICVASRIIERGLLRERAPPRESTVKALMVANPQGEYGTLPLCETVGRATALEMKNLSVEVTEFYKTPADQAGVRAALRDANLIVYQGHLSDQRLFDDPSFLLVESEIDRPHQSVHTPIPASTSSGSLFIPRGRSNAAGDFMAIAVEADHVDLNAPPLQPDFEVLLSVLPAVPRTVELRGAPIVILQSCRSLDEYTFERLSDLGCVGLVGSVSSIHSASGSTFVKSLIDNALYRRSTVGEALRDARNYFFCLQDLKDLRGHKEQAKSKRVALSFRLWGDPELQLFPVQPDKPQRRPVSATWLAPNKLQIRVPRRRLDRVATERYVIHGFPGASTAGVVKRLKKGAARRIKGLYFFRIRMPSQFADHNYTTVRRLHEDRRAVFRIDPMKRFLYVLHFPEKESPGETYTLQFASD